jgi:lipopolysaccharide/colanic/teichoic acid biosynthesis glycosyltransferase
MSAPYHSRPANGGRLSHVTAPRRDAASPTLVRSHYFAWKGLLDRLMAALLLIPGLPMIGILIVLVRLTSRGPGVYHQTRVGRGGRLFTMYKLRSMRIDAEARSGPTWAAPGKDPRVTSLGYWLRKLHLDELPQLFNVLRGEMSLIGPRPERPEFVDVLGRYIPEYHDRHTVAPGITGLAQINLPPDTDLDSVRRKVALDLEYIHTASLTLDCRMFLCTLLRMLGLRGDRAMSLMAVIRPIPHVKPTSGELHANGHTPGNVRLADLMQSLGLSAEASSLLAKARLESEQAERNESVPATAEALAAGNPLAAAEAITQ